MRKNVYFLYVVIFMLCMIIAPGMATLSNDSNSGKNVSTAKQVPILTTVTRQPSQTVQSDIAMYSIPRILDLYTIQDKNKTASLQQNKIIDKKNLTENQKKLSTALLLQTSAANGLRDTSNTMSMGKPVYVYVYVKSGYSTHIIDSFVSEVSNRDEDNHLAVTWMDVQNLELLASLEGVRTIQEVNPPEVRNGSVTTEGDVIHKTAHVRSIYGYTGAGMKIGIISDGVDHIAASQASGDLPADVTVLSNTQGGDEGTAMLEIVHDMVPDAKLYFHDRGSNILAFNAAVDELVANGCTIICDDIGWYDEPFFEDGIVASHINTVLSGNQLIYISATGNDADVHYQGNFYSYLGTNWTDFSSGTNATYPFLDVAIPPGNSVKIYLQWNDQFGNSRNDYDLYLSDLQNPTPSIGDLGYSINNQIGGFPDPIEKITYINLGSTTKYAEIDIKKYAGVSKTLELYIMGNGIVAPRNIVASDSIFGHPAVPDVIAVAAVPASSPSTIESFSSRGPVTITYPSAVGRLKPDISGVDRVSVTGVGGFGSPFPGTSASAPHIAAIAAQIWGAHPSLTPAQVRNALYSSAVDLGSAGKDTSFGYGRADALAMVNFTAVPVANFTAIPRSGNTPLIVQFNDTSTLNPTSWSWSFRNVMGNNTQIVFNTTQNPAHTFGVGNYSIVLDASNGAGHGISTQVTFINVSAAVTPTLSKIAVYRNSVWIIDSNDNFAWDGVPTDTVYTFSGTGNTSVYGDWNGDSKPEAGAYNNGIWYLDYNGNGVYDGAVIDRTATFGSTGYKPVVGDWNGNGNDKIGVELNGIWAIDYNGNYIWDGAVTDRFAAFGQAGDIPVIGDWDGTGKDKIGSHKDGFWAIDYNGNYVWDGAVTDRFAGLGQTADKPVIGDWNGDGKDKIGMQINGFWANDYNGNYVWEGAVTDRFAGFGSTGDIPVVGDWNNDGKAKIGSFKDGFWAIDYNGNYMWDGAVTDRFAGFGQTGDIPVVGKWS